MPTEQRPARPVLWDLGWTLVLTFVVFGPLLLGGGYWLFGDMVFVPEQPWKDAWLGLDGSLPRAVPMDALVSGATQVVPGWVLQRVLLVGGFVIGGLGAARLVRRHSTLARMAAITLFLWNPWVYEHLAMGQWAILDGYLLLPWAALAALRFRADARRGTPAVFLALVATAICSPSSGLMGALVVLVLAVGRPRALLRGAAIIGLAVVANLPWLVPTVTASSTDITVTGVFDAFAARGESALGTLASLFSLGGTWKTSIVPAERTSVVFVLLAGLLTAGALAGLRARRRDDREPETGRLLVLAGIAVALAWLPTLGAGAAALEQLGELVPGTAVLRDSNRFLAPAALVLVVGLAGATDWLRARARPGRQGWHVLAGLVVAAPVVLLPSLAWGTGGDWQRSDYPQEWAQVRSILEDEPPATTVVLPWAGNYRAFTWNDDRAVLDPAPRFFPGTVVIDDGLRVNGEALPSEDPQVAAVSAALSEADPAAALRGLGVRWVLVEGEVPVADVPEGEVVHDGEGLLLVDLGVPENQLNPAESPDRSTMIVFTDLAVLVLALLAIAGQVYILMFEWRSVRFGEDPST